MGAPLIAARPVAEDVRFAFRLAGLGFEREAARILADHDGDPLAESATKTLAGMTPCDARKAFLDLKQGASQ